MTTHYWWEKSTSESPWLGPDDLTEPGGPTPGRACRHHPLARGPGRVHPRTGCSRPRHPGLLHSAAGYSSKFNCSTGNRIIMSTGHLPPHKVRTLRQKRKVRRPSWHSQQVAQADLQLVLPAASTFNVKTALSANALEPGHGHCQLDCLKSISF